MQHGTMGWTLKQKRHQQKRSEANSVVLSVSWASLVAQLVKNLLAMQETPVWFLGWKDPLEKGIGYPLLCSLASLVAQMVKNPPAMQETWVWSLSREDPLEEGMATHSSILAWRIPRDRGALALSQCWLLDFDHYIMIMLDDNCRRNWMKDNKELFCLCNRDKPKIFIL